MNNSAGSIESLLSIVFGSMERFFDFKEQTVDYPIEQRKQEIKPLINGIVESYFSLRKYYEQKTD